MSHKRKMKTWLAYIYMPLLFMILGYGLIYLAGKPVIDIARSTVGMVFTNSTKNTDGQLDSIFTKESKVTSGNLNYTSIERPSYETLYGQIICKRISLDAPLYYGDSDSVFDVGAGQYMGSGIPGLGTSILVGGHDSTFFAPLQYVKKGDTITVKTNYGTFQYKVSGTKIVNEYDSSAYDLNKDKEQLILYTCYPFGVYIGIKDKRYYVYADKISGPTVIKEEGTQDE